MAPGSEVRIRIPELHRLPTALIRILAADGIGGAKMDQVLSSEILVECVGCGIRVSIAELMALRSSPPDDSNPKINRLRLGYCARNSCLSQFYGISVGRDVGLDPELMRERLAAEIASSKPEPEELTDDESPGKSPSSDLIKRGALRIGGAALLVVVFFWWRAGVSGGVKVV